MASKRTSLTPMGNPSSVLATIIFLVGFQLEFTSLNVYIAASKPMIPETDLGGKGITVGRVDIDMQKGVHSDCD